MRCTTGNHFRADDTSLTYASNNIDDINDKVNDDLRRVFVWLAANKLTINLSKTEFLLIGSRQRLSGFHTTPLLTINGKQITQASSARSFGVIIDENLSWEDHIQSISKNVSSGINALKRTRHFVFMDTLILVYNALIKRILTFSNYDTRILKTYLMPWDGCH